MGSQSESAVTPLNDIKAIVVGAGFGGLASAIELRKRGANVTVLEAYPDMKKLGGLRSVSTRFWPC